MPHFVTLIKFLISNPFLISHLSFTLSSKAKKVFLSKELFFRCHHRGCHFASLKPLQVLLSERIPGYCCIDLCCSFLFKCLDFVSISIISKRKEKITEVESKDELDFYPNMLRGPLFDSQIPLDDVGPSSVKSILRKTTLEISSSSDDGESNRNSSEGVSNSGETSSSSGAEGINEKGSSGKIPPRRSDQLRIGKLAKEQKLSSIL